MPAGWLGGSGPPFLQFVGPPRSLSQCACAPAGPFLQCIHRATVALTEDTMHAYQPTYFSSHPALVRTVRVAVVVAVVGLLAAAWGTAGPGNYYQPPQTRVTLPQVVVVGQRDTGRADVAISGGCERGQADAVRAVRRLG